MFALFPLSLKGMGVSMDPFVLLAQLKLIGIFPFFSAEAMFFPREICKAIY